MSYTSEKLIDDRQNGVFRVHRSLMTSPEVYMDEQRRIFDHCWLYVGHESEIEKPGDYVRRTVAGRPLIFLRDSGGEVRVFYNTCTHRGATLCREDSGNTRVFQCFYHAWSFDNTGRLLVTPGAEGYSSGFRKADYNLRGPARVDGYRGLYFVNFDRDAPDLVDYLGAATEYLDLVFDQACDGMRVVDGSHLYSVGSNWKLMVENSMDGYHAPTVHATYIDFVKDSGGGQRGNALNTGGGLDLGNGHAVMESLAAWARPIAYWEPFFGDDARADIEAILDDLIARHGEERARRMAGTFRNLLIFPNLIINDVAAITIRRIEPLAADRHRLEAWALAPKEEVSGSARLQRRLDSFLTFLGPGGFASPDDVEALESCQEGFRADEPEWSDISRGMSTAPNPQDEIQIRTFWRAYVSMLDTGKFAERVTSLEAPATAAMEAAS
ncbi:aromatic-ring-hydroxylating dioxygenase subunit alpha [Acrocarpospora macrocephala]|uniref:Aromatic-ring-hydroxylating dioxygenase subunit alpha n=1 Tax=Acrocarpospora macrocephala TaxID=150177 RepID=A0A5M3WL35_9ACTN|nr:aromatic ring-hydroxylating dioxygenase subunit alpha [Acrocarpospora macrocephala]GES09604.1 aromatic-ring-hydroxylating dioxygenase subunit alpha [Acrocarpospora macrocephala]